MNNEYPGYPEESALGNRGLRIVGDIIEDSFGWILRETVKTDLGIDAYVEILDKERKSKGRIFALQIRCGHSFFREATNDGYVYRGEIKHLNYWTEYSLPVILVLCNPDTRTCHWVQITSGNVERTGSGWKVVVPFSQTLRESKDELDLLMRAPQLSDVVALGLYRLVAEKFGNRVQIAQDADAPPDFCYFDYLALLDDEQVSIKCIYRPIHTFQRSDVEEIFSSIRFYFKPDFMPKIMFFFVAHKTEDLQPTAFLLETLENHPNI